MARILLVEESPAERALARKTLLAGGHSLVEATTAADALVELARQPIDVIVLDSALPDASGDEVVNAVRHTIAHALTPIIETLPSEPSEPANRRRWFRARERPRARTLLADFAVERLAKPFAPHQLTEAVQRALNLRAEHGGVAGDLHERARTFDELTNLQAEARKHLDG